MEFIDGLTTEELREIFAAFLTDVLGENATPEVVEHNWQRFLLRVREKATIVER